MSEENRKQEELRGLMEYIERGVSPYHVVETAAKEFEEAGFKELELSGNWSLNKGGCYYVKAHGSSLFAFRVNPGFGRLQSFRIAAAHTDWPCMRIKMLPDMCQDTYAKVNVEVYGGPILNTWLDRPLSVAGRVTLKGKSCFAPETRLVDLKYPVFTIPNLAIHMNREVNKGVELNKQKDMIPLAGQVEDKLNKNGYFMKALAEAMGVSAEEILFFELSVYNCDKGDIIGMNGEFFSAPRLDNLTSVKACVDGLLAGTERKKGVDMAAFFDHEEVGSRTKQGAGSVLLPLVMEKICRSFDYSDEDCINSLLKSFLLSVDVAHGMHPNQPEKSDLTNKVYLNGGVVLKTESNQRYANDGTAVGIIRGLCGKNKIPCQFFANRSDMAGGSTLGAIASSFAAMKAADIGIPLLAMHSARETMGRKDQAALTSLLEAYWKEK